MIGKNIIIVFLVIFMVLLFYGFYSTIGVEEPGPGATTEIFINSESVEDLDELEAVSGVVPIYLFLPDIKAVTVNGKVVEVLKNELTLNLNGTFLSIYIDKVVPVYGPVGTLTVNGSLIIDDIGIFAIKVGDLVSVWIFQDEGLKVFSVKIL